MLLLLGRAAEMSEQTGMTWNTCIYRVIRLKWVKNVVISFQIQTEGQIISDAQVEEARQGELAALAVRKYLDALCVYFWAATSLLTSILTFSLFVLLGHALTAEIVFTSLALFGVLIAPLNSFPWVINGCVEAVVSVRRLERCHLPSSLWPSL